MGQDAYDALMRTTVTIDDELNEEVRRQAFVERRTLGAVINDLLARGLEHRRGATRVLGAFTGQITAADDFDETPPEVELSLDEPV